MEFVSDHCSHRKITSAQRNQKIFVDLRRRTLSCVSREVGFTHLDREKREKYQYRIEGICTLLTLLWGCGDPWRIVMVGPYVDFVSLSNITRDFVNMTAGIEYYTSHHEVWHELWYGNNILISALLLDIQLQICCQLRLQYSHLTSTLTLRNVSDISLHDRCSPGTAGKHCFPGHRITKSQDVTMGFLDTQFQ